MGIRRFCEHWEVCGETDDSVRTHGGFNLGLSAHVVTTESLHFILDRKSEGASKRDSKVKVNVLVLIGKVKRWSPSDAVRLTLNLLEPSLLCHQFAESLISLGCCRAGGLHVAWLQICLSNDKTCNSPEAIWNTSMCLKQSWCKNVYIQPVKGDHFFDGCTRLYTVWTRSFVG